MCGLDSLKELHVKVDGKLTVRNIKLVEKCSDVGL